MTVLPDVKDINAVESFGRDRGSVLQWTLLPPNSFL
jgi:hypothetical protein